MKSPYYIYLSLLLFLALDFVSCSEHQNTETLNRAEYVMETYPDSALSILEGIDKSEITSDADMARYALLMSMALDKNYIDTTDFNVLQPAIDYYERHGNSEEKFHTHYYSGRIYQNQGDDDSAMKQFMKAADLRNEISDSTLLAHTLVAMATLYFRQYKIKEFIEANIDAAEIYGSIGKHIPEIKSYTNAIDGYTVLHEKSTADSILSICIPLVKEYPEGEEFLYTSLLSFTIEFSTQEQIEALLNDCQDWNLSTDEALDFALGYSKIGEIDKAIDIISNIQLEDNILDSLRYLAIESIIFEKKGDYSRALSLYKEYSTMQESYQAHILSQDLMFADERHQLEISNLTALRKKDSIILGILSSSFVLLMLVGLVYYKYRLSLSKRLIVEADNKNMKLREENINKEKEKAELERDKKALEAENLEKERLRLVAEQRQKELETANLILEKNQLEGERDSLKELLKEQSELSRPVQQAIKTRLDMLNGLLAKEITNKESYARPFNRLIEEIHSDKNKFMNSMRRGFSESHPGFIEYLQSNGLSIDEINYICLYAIGLRGKEIGEYTLNSRHYIISSEIRRKLGIDEHETNLGQFIRRKINELY